MISRKIAAGACAAALALSMLAVVGCSPSEPAPDQAGASGYVADGLPGLMPEDHEGRFVTMGADGCFNCHGSSEDAYPILGTAQPLPADHFQGGSVDSHVLDNARAECITCHSQG